MTKVVSRCRSLGICFNPHSHIRSDCLLPPFGKSLIMFQSTLPHKEWLINAGGSIDYKMFQSTLPHKEWRTLPFILANMDCFNPHSHIRSDERHQRGRQINQLFQSTLPHKEWLDVLILFKTHAGFNPHSHIRSDIYMEDLKLKLEVSIHTPT